MRDILWGFVTWVLVVGSVIGVVALMTHLVGPPISDRGRSAMFMLGGAGLLMAIVILTVIGLTLYFQSGSQ